MEKLEKLSNLEKRKWLVKELNAKWYLDNDDIVEGDCKDDACVEGNAGISFIEVFNLCEQFCWEGIEIGRSEIEIDLFVPRERKINQKAWEHSSDEFRICDGILTMWFD